MTPRCHYSELYIPAEVSSFFPVHNAHSTIARSHHQPASARVPARENTEMGWMEDFQRALSSRGVTVASIPGKGRGLVTTRDFSPGMI